MSLADSPGAAKFSDMAKANGFAAGPFAPESYDGAALICWRCSLHIFRQQVFKAHMMGVANAPGEKIFPGELGKAMKLLSEGKDIDYVGASAVELVGGGESAGNYAEIEIKGGKNVTVGYR